MEPKKALTLLFFLQLAALGYSKLILQTNLKARRRVFAGDVTYDKRHGDGLIGDLFRDYWMLVGLFFLIVFYFSLRAVVQRSSDWKEFVGIYALSFLLTIAAASIAWYSTGKLFPSHY